MNATIIKKIQRPAEETIAGLLNQQSLFCQYLDNLVWGHSVREIASDRQLRKEFQALVKENRELIDKIAEARAKQFLAQEERN